MRAQSCDEILIGGGNGRNFSNLVLAMADWLGPLPEISDETAFYWHGLRDGQVLLLQCKSCGTWIHYPRPVCKVCYGRDLSPRAVSGRGKVYTYSIVNREFVTGVKPPYVAALVDVVDAPGVRVITNIINCAPGDVHFGMPVRAVFRRASDEIGLLFFEPEPEVPDVATGVACLG